MLVAHAPKSFSKLYSMVSSVLNERMQAKITVLAEGTPVLPLAQTLDAKALHSWGKVCVRQFPLHAHVHARAMSAMTVTSHSLTRGWLLFAVRLSLASLTFS